MPSSQFLLSYFVQTLLRGTGWLVVLLLVTPLLKRRLSASGRAVMWQTAFVGLILLPLLLLLPPLPLLPTVHPTPNLARTSLLQAPSPHVALPALDFPRSSVPRGDALPTGRPHAAGAGLSAPSIPAGVAPPTIRLELAGTRWLWLLLFGWSVGAALLLIRLVHGLMTLRHLEQGAVAVSPELAKMTRDCVARLDVRCAIDLRIAASDTGQSAPITWGFRRPIVLLPADYILESPARCEAILLHELTHVRRGDWIWLVLMQGVCAFYWCVPFVWTAARRLNMEMEMACDDCVLAAGISAPDYATQILEVVRKMQTENARLRNLTVMPMARQPLAEARIRAILEGTRSRRSSSRSVLVMAAVLPLLSLPLISLRAIAGPGSYPIPLVVAPPLPTPSEPVSSALTALPTEGTPLPIHKIASHPSPPMDRSSVNGSTIVEIPAVILETSLPGPPLHTAIPADRDVPAIVWGPVVKGLQAGLRLVDPKPGFAPGEPIWQETYLRNKTAQPVNVQSIRFYEEQGAPIILSAKGASVKVLRYCGMGMMLVANTRVDPGEMAQVGRVAVAFHEGAPGETSPHEVAPGVAFAAEGMPLAYGGPGAYTLAQEISPLDSSDKPLKVTLRTGALPVQIRNVPPVQTPRVDHNLVVDLATAPIAWGAVHAGLQIGLISLGSKQEYFVGERVRVAVVLRNVSKAPISFRHQTAFAFMETPKVTDADGKPRAVLLAPETAWSAVSGIRMTGVTFDMTSAPSADGPSHIRQSEIAPGQSVLGYGLAGFVVPAHWQGGQAVPGHYRLTQPLRIGLGQDEGLDTILETGAVSITLSDPDAITNRSDRL